MKVYTVSWQKTDFINGERRKKDFCSVVKRCWLWGFNIWEDQAKYPSPCSKYPLTLPDSDGANVSGLGILEAHWCVYTLFLPPGSSAKGSVESISLYKRGLWPSCWWLFANKSCVLFLLPSSCAFSKTLKQHSSQHSLLLIYRAGHLRREL